MPSIILKLCAIALLAVTASASNAEGLAYLETKKAEPGVVRRHRNSSRYSMPSLNLFFMMLDNSRVNVN